MNAHDVFVRSVHDTDWVGREKWQIVCRSCSRVIGESTEGHLDLVDIMAAREAHVNATSSKVRFTP